MGLFNGKIYLTGIISAIVLLSTCCICAQQHDEDITAHGIKVPIYDDDKVLPILILYGKKAVPVGVRFELAGVRLEWIGDTIDEIKGIVSTPSAIYCRDTKTVSGNDQIKYRSDIMDLDGIGFDIDQVKQTIHIRSKVKVVIKDKMETKRQQRQAVKKAKKAKKTSPASDEDGKELKINIKNFLSE